MRVWLYSFGVGEQSIKLFIPDNTVDPSQYTRGGASNIATVGIIGDFQHLVAPGATDWDQASALPMTLTAHPNGYLFVYAFNPPLPKGWYQYQYVVRFNERRCAWSATPAPSTAAIRWTARHLSLADCRPRRSR